MSKNTNDDLTRSGTGCFIAVPICRQWQAIDSVVSIDSIFQKRHPLWSRNVITYSKPGKSLTSQARNYDLWHVSECEEQLHFDSMLTVSFLS